MKALGCQAAAAPEVLGGESIPPQDGLPAPSPALNEDERASAARVESNLEGIRGVS